MSSGWSNQWEGACPRCDSNWIHYERRTDGVTEHRREGYTRLSDWTLECEDCDYISNEKRTFW
jgi:hypothetical protein